MPRSQRSPSATTSFTQASAAPRLSGVTNDSGVDAYRSCRSSMDLGRSEQQQPEHGEEHVTFSEGEVTPRVDFDPDAEGYDGEDYRKANVALRRGSQGGKTISAKPSMTPTLVGAEAVRQSRFTFNKSSAEDAAAAAAAGVKHHEEAMAISDHKVAAHQPPPFEYDFWGRRWSLFWNLVAVVAINSIAPAIAFYISGHVTNQVPAKQYSWVTLSLGTLELFHYPFRAWQICKKDFERSAYPSSFGRSRVAGVGAGAGYSSSSDANLLPSSTARREGESGTRYVLRFIAGVLLHFDFFQWALLCGMVVGAVLLSLAAGTNGDRGNFTLLLLAIPLIAGVIGAALLLSVLLYAFSIQTPSWAYVSCVTPRQRIRPAIYYVMEDLVAVDGAGAWKFRDVSLIFSVWGILFPVWAGLHTSRMLTRERHWFALNSPSVSAVQPPAEKAAEGQ
ncbi:hypothetical protein IE81DRAFT_339026 [Ceraceosorus guamensis]|uniref:Uncharacterized protein n=1 Tax=Ceraceosorus guamensis TaxID=1522189 RepID=A0A316W7E7_9BASI|nr:hypothetical protein IE81DRAFT_339026 [Ceraceosorus guamensis]PWN45797.1 hypothetical protein IE81DRAFT_339026 [Ceraceosorus guamensis]